MVDNKIIAGLRHEISKVTSWTINYFFIPLKRKIMLKFEKHCQTQAFTSELQGQIINEKVWRLGEVGLGRESHTVSWEVE